LSSRFASHRWRRHDGREPGAASPLPGPVRAASGSALPSFVATGSPSTRFAAAGAGCRPDRANLRHGFPRHRPTYAAGTATNLSLHP